MNEWTHPAENVSMRECCSVLFKSPVALLDAFPVFDAKARLQLLTSPVPVCRPARGIFLHHDRHAAGRGAADLERTDPTSGGGRGSSTGSRVGDERNHTRTNTFVARE